MKQKLLLTLAAMLFAVGAWAQNSTTRLVNENFTSSTSGWNSTHFSTIQAAIDAATAGDVIEVAAGTYEEALIINKSLTLLGANSGNSPNIIDLRVSETILKPQSATAITGDASNITVVFKGFTVDMENTGTSEQPSNYRFMNQTGKANTIWTFEHNIFTNAYYVSSGHWLINGSNAGLVFNLNDNLFTGNEVSNGLSIWDTNPNTVNITDNVWRDNGYTGLNLNSSQGTISGNTFIDTRTINVEDAGYYFGNYQSGILLASANFNLSITNNTFDNVHYGVVLYQSVDGTVTISKNTFDGTILSSVRASGSQEGGDLDDVTVVNNAFINYAGDGKQIANTRADNQTLNVSCNWWGTTAGPGEGQIDDEVNASTWLVSSDLESPVCFGGLPNVLLDEKFDEELELFSEDVNQAWYVDRYAPSVFERFSFDDEYVLKIATDLGADERGGQSGSFYNTHGRKFNQSGLGATTLRGELYIPEDWDHNHRRSDIWATMQDANGTITAYPIIGFRNVDGESPTFSYWTTEWVDVDEEIDYNAWNAFEFKMQDGFFHYYINGSKVGTFSSGASSEIQNVIIQIYNFDDSFLGDGQYELDNSYSAYWDNIKTTTGGSVHNTVKGTYYASIQAAINAATAGDVIEVAAGTYTEAVTLNKAITLKGANAGIAAGNAPGERVNETIIDGGFIVSAAATLDGLTIKNGCASGSIKVGVAVASSDVSILNCIIQDVSAPDQSDGISTQTNNSNLILTNSTIKNNWRGIYLNPGSGHTFSGNLIDANNGVGVGIGSDGLSDFTLISNTISNHILEGWGASSVGIDVVAENNSLVNNLKSIAQYSGSVINASCNWWGTTVATDVAAKISGNVTATNILQSNVIDPAAPDYYCTSGLNNPVQNLNTLVTYTTIQAAINAATAGDVIQVAPGTYGEQLSIDKKITLKGPNFGIAGHGTRVDEAIVTFPENLTGNQDLVIITANDVIIDGFTFDGENYTPEDGASGLIGYADRTVVKNTIISNFNYVSVWFSSYSPYYPNPSGYGFYRKDIVVENNYIHNAAIFNESNGSVIGYGIYMQGAYGTVTCNVVEDTKDAIQIQPYNHPNTGDVTGTVSNNTFEGYREPVWFNYSENTNAKWAITNNTLNGIAPPTGHTEIEWRGFRIQTCAAVGTFDFSGNTINIGTANATSMVALKKFANVVEGMVDLDEVFTNNTWERCAVISDGTNILEPSGSDVYFYLNIQPAIYTSATGNVVRVAPGNYPQSTTLYINKAISLIGDGSATTTIDLTALEGTTAYGITTTASDITFSGFTILHVSHADATNGFTLKAGNTAANPLNENLVLSDLVVVGAHRTPFDFHGINNITVSGLVAKNTVAGNGMQFTGCHNVTVNSFTDENNAWGAIAVYASRVVVRASQNVSISGSGLNITGNIYSQDDIDGLNNLYNSNVQVTDWNFIVQNSAFRTQNDSEEYTFFAEDLNAAEAIGSALNVMNNGNTKSVVKELSSGIWMVPMGLSIQSAIDAATAGDVIQVTAGSFDETIAINKAISLRGAQHNVDPGENGWASDITELSPATNGDNAITITASNVSVKGFKVTDVSLASATIYAGGGIIAQGADANNLLSGIDLSSNWITENQSNGVWMTNVSNPTIQNNLITDNTGSNVAGISLYAAGTNKITGGLVHGNTISGSDQSYGIYLASAVNAENSVTGLTISNNTLSENGKYGLQILSHNFNNAVNNIDVVGNTISGNTRNGLKLVDVNSIRVNSNTISGNGDSNNDPKYNYGIMVENQAGTRQARNNSFTGNSFNGNVLGSVIYLGSGDIDGNVFRDNRFSETIANPQVKYGINNTNTNSINVDAYQNWWNAPTGPTHSGNSLGTGVKVSDDVLYNPFWVDSTFSQLSPVEVTGDPNGNAEFEAPGTNVSGTFQTAGTLSITYINDEPAGQQTKNSSNFGSNYEILEGYWEVENTTGSVVTVDLSFDLSNKTGLKNLKRVLLLSREYNASNPNVWTLKGAADVIDGLELTWEGLDIAAYSTYEFAVANGDQVDIEVVRTACESYDVVLKPTVDITNGTISNIQFTLKWDSSSAPAITFNNANASVEQQGSNAISGDYTYATFAAAPLSSSSLLNAGTTVLTFTHNQTGSGTGSFTIMADDDSYATPGNVFYVEVGGTEYTGMNTANAEDVPYGKCEVSIASFTVTNKTYDGNTTATFSSEPSLAGVIGSDEVSATGLSAVFSNKNAGTGKLVSLEDNNNSNLTNNLEGANLEKYTLVSIAATTTADITPKELTASISGNPTKVYDGTTVATLSSANYSMQTDVGSESILITKTSGTYAIAGAGTRIVTVELDNTLPTADFAAQGATLLSNYSLPTSATGNGTITKAPLTVTADDKSKVYDGVVFSPFTASYSGFVNNEGTEVLVGSLTFNGNAVDATAVESYTITPVGYTADNYAITYVDGTLTISPVSFALKTFLQGMFDATSGALSTSLRSKNQVPIAHPYTGAPWNYSGTAENYAVIGDIPANAVDWILVEFRGDNNESLGKAAGMLRANGSLDVLVSAANVKAGSEYDLILYHRNHLPIRIENVTAPLTVRKDLTTTNSTGGIQLGADAPYGMVAGNVNPDNRLQYSGPGNDRGPILAKILANGGSGFADVYTGEPGFYFLEDVNADGTISYTGDNNDRGIILTNLGSLTNNQQLNAIYYTPVDGNQAKIKARNDGPIGIDWLGSELVLAPEYDVPGTLLDNIQFTLAWDADDSDVTSIVESFESDYGLLPQGEALNIEGVMHQTFVSLALNRLPEVWNAGATISIMRFDESIADRVWIADNFYTELNNGMYYVSLRGEDQTGSVKIGSDVNEAMQLGDLTMTAYPNPAQSGQIKLAFSAVTDTPATIELLDMQGNRLRSFTTTLTQDLPVNVSDLSSGMYLIQVQLGDHFYQTRVVLIKQ